ncbi:MAG: c-type cytochrome [Chloroflexi bacterium]|nr:c-type cytochrome [Chloroflexota bacterium]
MSFVRLIIIATIATLLAAVGACAPGGAVTPTPKPPTGAPAGNPERGKEIYETRASPACSTCHVVAGRGTQIGPELTKIATTAATRKPGMSAEAYIRESITDPSAFVVSGFPDGVMPKTYGQTLSAEQLSDLVAYYMTLK